MDAEDVSGEVKLQQPPFMTELQLTAGVCPPPTQPFEVQTEAFDSTFHLHLWAPQRRRCESECQIDCISCVRNKNTLVYSLSCEGCFTGKCVCEKFQIWLSGAESVPAKCFNKRVNCRPLRFTAVPARFLLFFLIFIQEAFHPFDYSDDMIFSFIRIKYCTFQCCSGETSQPLIRPESQMFFFLALQRIF